MTTDRKDQSLLKRASKTSRPPGKFHVREVGLRDRPQVEKIGLTAEQELFAGSVEDVFRDLASSAHPDLDHAFMLENEGEPVGFFVLRERDQMPPWAPKDAMTLQSVRVDFSHQNKGMGRSIVEFAIRWIAQNRPQICFLMLAVNARNLDAQRAYRAFGFEDTGIAHAGPFGRQLLMRKPVRDPLRIAMD